jgi:regulator of PEP synthase PpsR (kinase-PPPase family)
MPDKPQTIPSYFHMHLVSDSTGETLISVARASSGQFKRVMPVEHLYALVRSPRQIDRVMEEIRAAPGIVMFTILNPELRRHLEQRCAELAIPTIAVLDPVLAAVGRYLGQEASSQVGAQRTLDAEYYHRIEAMNYAMAHDDGQNLDGYEDADVVLVGVSRTSKTPTCIYLANRGVKAANIPVVPGVDLPPEIAALKHPLVVGLTATPERLVQIRKNRLLSLRQTEQTDYADELRVKEEILQAKRLFARHGWTSIDVTRRSIEETSAKILNMIADKRGEHIISEH